VAGDTLVFWLPDPPEQPAYGMVGRSGGRFAEFAIAFSGSVTVLGERLTGAFSGFTLDVTRTAGGLSGTVAEGGTNPSPVTLVRHDARGTGLTGRWVTRSVTGTPGAVYLDTLELREDGRSTIGNRWSLDGGSCEARNVHGLFERTGDLVRLRFFWPDLVPPPCTIRLRDSLTLVGDTLVRTRPGPTGTIVEKLAR